MITGVFCIYVTFSCRKEGFPGKTPRYVSVCQAEKEKKLMRAYSLWTTDSSQVSFSSPRDPIRIRILHRWRDQSLSYYFSINSHFDSYCFSVFRSSPSFSQAMRSEKNRSPKRPCRLAAVTTTRTDTKQWWVNPNLAAFVVETRGKHLIRCFFHSALPELLFSSDCCLLPPPNRYLWPLTLLFTLVIIQPSSSHPLSLSLRRPPPFCPDTSSHWRWWTGSALRGTSGTTTAHRATRRATGLPRRWTKTSASRWDWWVPPELVRNKSWLVAESSDDGCKSVKTSIGLAFVKGQLLDTLQFNEIKGGEGVFICFFTADDDL